MAITQTDDFTNLHDADTSGIGEWAFDGGVFKSGGTQTVGAIEGTGCIEIRVNSTGQGDATVLFAAAITALGDGHLWAWFRETFEYDTFAANGIVMGIAADIGAPATDFGSWQTQGADRSISCYDGWVRAVINPFLAFDHQAGTPPLRTSFTHGMYRMQMEASGRDVPMLDAVDRGIGTNTITGGTVAAPGLFSEIVTADFAAARGLWKSKIGIFYTNCHTIFGDVGTAESNITESNKTVIFEFNRMQAHIQEIECVGNATSSLNKVLFGTISGTGVDEVGAAGINFINAGIVPFHFRADDANCDEMRIAGCSFLNADAAYEEAWMSCWVNTTNETVDINDPGTGDVVLTTPTSDFVAFGHAAPFDSITINVTAAATGSPVVVWEYSTGTSTWATLTDLTDGTNAFTTTASNTVTFAIPTNWVEGTLSSVSRFYIRARTTTSPSAAGSLTSSTARFTGRVRLEQTNVKCISSSFTNMGTITVNSGADFKKCSIVDSLAPAKSAALDFGDTDPVADTVRDITINGGVNGISVGDVTRFFNAGAAVDKGGGKVGIPDTAAGFADGQEILIAGTTNYNGVQTVDATSSANEIVITDTFVSETFAITDSAVPNTTYNLRNITFAGLTDSVYLEFPATSTVTLNIVDGGDSLVVGDVNNVNSSTLVINNATATVLVNVKNVSAANLQNARVFIETAATIASGEEFEGAVTTLSQASGTATVTCTGVHDLVTGDKIVIRGAQPDGYNKVATATVSSTTVFTYPVDSGLGSPATGTILVSYVAIHGLTDVNGDISVNRTWTAAQQMKGWVRLKNTASPFYKDANIAFTVDTAAGNVINTVLQSDE